jgi:hypothetical protein
MAASEKTISALVSGQLPDFIRADHPKFQKFVELYYQWLENNSTTGISNTAGNTVYHAMNIDTYRDIDETPDEFIRYFKQELLPYFPEQTALSTEKILKSAREFYSKKGSDESVRWLFKALFNEDIEILYPKEEILIASDGKWTKPKAFRITISETNKNLDVNLLEKRLIVGTESGATCVIESANRTIDKVNGKEIIEIYVSNVKRYFNNGERIRVEYVDEFGVQKVFLERIIGTLSNVKIDSNIKTDRSQRRRGLLYNVGDPVIITGGLGLTGDAEDAIAVVGNVTSGSIESVTTTFPGYGYRLYSNTEIIVYRGAQDDPKANLFTDLRVDVLNENESSANSQRHFLIPITYDRTVIDYLSDTEIQDTNYDPFTENNRNVLLTVTETDQGDYFFPNEQIWVGGTNFTDASLTAKIATANNIVFGVSGATANSGQLLIYDIKTLGGLSIADILIAGAQIQTKNTDKVFLVNSLDNIQVPANVNSQLVQCFDFVTETTGGIAGAGVTGGISLISVLNGGAGFRKAPTLGIESHYDTQLSQQFDYEEEKEFKRASWQTFRDLGLISQVRILDGGRGYSVGDVITFSGRGYGGSANVQSVGSGGRITSINIIDRGEGYTERAQVHVTRNSPVYTNLMGTANIEAGTSLVIGTGTTFSSPGGAGANNRNLIRINGEVRRVLSVVNSTHLYVNTAFLTSANDVVVQKQNGVEPVLVAYRFGDGVENTVNTSAIGRIKDLRLIYRGFDYVSTPNVSLKILDTVINPIPESNVFTETEYVYQGQSIANSTFKANVKSYNRETGVLRLYDFSGSFSNTVDIISANGIYCNSNLSMNVPAPEQYPAEVVAEGLPNPMRYGNGLAKAKAFFANGLIEFNGFYLNSDGFLSADKVIQDGDIYHNFSYVIESEKNLVDYETTVKNIAHPVGMAMIAKTLAKSENERAVSAFPQITTILDGNRTQGGTGETANVSNSRSNVVTGHATDWLPDANIVASYANNRVNVGDLIILDDDPDDIIVPEVARLPISKVVSKVNSNTELEVYGDFIYRGQGLLKSNVLFTTIGFAGTQGNLVSGSIVADVPTRFDGWTYIGGSIGGSSGSSTWNVSRVNVSITSGSSVITGYNTKFESVPGLNVNSIIVVGNPNAFENVAALEKKKVLSINAEVQQIVVNSAFSNTNSGQSLLLYSPSLLVIKPNDYVSVGQQARRVISVVNANTFIVNTAFTTQTDTPISLLSNTRLFVTGNANVLSEYVRANDEISLNIFSANAYTAQTGTVQVSTSNTIVIGTGTSFNSDVVINDYIMIGNQIRQVINITNATMMTVDVPYNSNVSGAVYTKRAGVQTVKVVSVSGNSLEVNTAYLGNTTNAVYHVIPNLKSNLKYKIVTLTGN